MNRIALFLLVLLPVQALAQRGLMERKRPEIIPTDGKMRRGGFYFAPGITYTFSQASEKHYNWADASGDVWYEPEGRIGLYLEAGWFHATFDPVILDYWDFGLAYKEIKGYERSYGRVFSGWTMAEDVWSDGQAAFADQYLTLHANANKFFQTGDYQFIQLSIGANADYRIGRSTSTSGIPFSYDLNHPPDLIAQLHFKLGYGFKVSKRLLVIPALETPVFSVLPEDRGFGQLQWFSSLYRPVIFSVRFLFLRYPKGFDCPPAIKHNALERERHKVYKQEGFHP